MSAFVQVTAWCFTNEKQSSELMITHSIDVYEFQWINMGDYQSY